jgi:hypothetical protein
VSVCAVFYSKDVVHLCWLCNSILNLLPLMTVLLFWRQFEEGQVPEGEDCREGRMGWHWDTPYLQSTQGSRWW